MMDIGNFDVRFKGLLPELVHTPHSCHVEYWVPPCHTGEPCVHRFINSWKMPYDMEIVAVHNHFHTGARNMTTSTENRIPICVGLPTYSGGFLIKNSNC